MDIVFRVDSSIHIGSGHVMRCLVLAQELRRLRYSIRFVTRPQNGDSIEHIRQQGFVVIELPQPQEELTPRTSADYLAWLQVPVKSDMEDFCSTIKCTDLVVVDHYALGKDWQESVKKYLGCKVVAIDDLVRQHCADIIVDQTLYRSPDEYAAKNSGSIILTGTDYALLNTQFSTKREQALDDELDDTAIRVLVSLGGIDKDNVTIEVLKTLLLLGAKKPKVTVLLSEKSPSYDSVKNFCVEQAGWVHHISFVENMAEIMLEHTISIGASGTTSWERACLGVPSIIIPLAENQRVVATNLVKAGAAILVEPGNINEKLTGSYQKLLKHRLKYRRKNLSLCDGLGVKRVANFIKSLLADNARKIFLRRAQTDDIRQVYAWQCNPETRKFALTKEMPAWETHQKWMKQKLLSKSDYFYMVVLAGSQEAVGVVRLDRVRRAEYLVSIFLYSEYFGQGIAKQTLRNVDDIHQQVTLRATVLEDNVASQRLFVAAGYQRVSEESFIRLPII